MGPRNLLILFFSTVAVSLVILVIFFSLFFKNIDLNFNTKLPQSAPDIGGLYDKGMSPESKADGLLRSTVNVPPEVREPEPDRRADAARKEPSDTALPPVTDDVMLRDEPLGAPVPAGRSEPPPPKPSPSAASTAERPHPKPRPEPRPAPEPEAPQPIEDIPSSAPPVPGQG